MSRRRLAFVRLHPADDPSKLPPVFLGHPDDFVPQPDAVTGRIERWGLVTDDPEEVEKDGGRGAQMAFIERIMRTQTMYGFMAGGLKKPEEQFVDALIARKERTLQAGKEAAAPLYKRDYIVDVDLALYQRDFRTSPRVWRRIRVSGGTSLAALQDKIITPAMGWTRNYHASLWCDHRDGALFGDPECRAIDMMHVHLHFHGFVDQGPWRLADLLQEEGQHLSWMYDIGDQWRHVLTLVQVVPEEESTGKVEVLDGAMACPPEDSNGLEGMGPHSYQTFLEKWANPTWRTSSAGRKALAEASGALNYRDVPGGFKPERFSVAEAQRVVEAALASRASVSSGAKQFCMPVAPVGGFPLGGNAGRGRRCAASTRAAALSCRRQWQPAKMLALWRSAARAAPHTTCRAARAASWSGTAPRSARRRPGRITSGSARQSRRGGQHGRQPAPGRRRAANEPT